MNDHEVHRSQPAPDDYFARFGLDRRFELDEQALSERYQALLSRKHGRAAARGAAEIEQAHRVLADPELRADYLLDLTGGPTARELDTIWARAAADDRRLAAAMGRRDRSR